MNRRYLPMLVLLALIWGSSFMFIKIAVRELDPATLVFGRLGARSAGARCRRARLDQPPSRSASRFAPTGRRSSSSACSTRRSRSGSSPGARRGSTPGSPRSSRPPCRSSTPCSPSASSASSASRAGRLVGVVVGFVGVALLVGAQPEAKVLGALAVVGMAVCYGAGGLLARRYLADVSPSVVAFGTTAIAAFVMMPAGVARAPEHIPGWKTFASIARARESSRRRSHTSSSSRSSPAPGRRTPPS